ncbi:MAG TPA: hypothetical protein DC053_03875 [Lachnoclostridium sp.]|nr:hypothetical protein [Lachnoclostridium sp.]
MKNSYIARDNDVIRFDLCKLEKNKERLCQCKNPHYEVDAINRLVTCEDCGAIIDPFDALVNICKHQDNYKEYQKEAIEKVKLYRELADKEWRRRLKNACFKDMEKRYINGMHPECPVCGELFDPVKITRWSRPNRRTGQQEIDKA